MEHAASGSAPMLVKLLMVGDTAVGKTSALMRYVDDEFSTKFMSTIGVDYKDKQVVVDGTSIKLQIWDTAGQERFRTLTTSFYRRTQGILLMYDVTNRASFENVREWVKEIQDNAAPGVARVLFGNQCDRIADKVVSTADGRQLAGQFQMHFFEGSAKRDENIDEAFGCLVREVKKALEASQSPLRATAAQTPGTITLDETSAIGQEQLSTGKKPKSACC